MTKGLKTHSVLQDRRGAALVEFALIAPVLIWLIIAIIEFGMVFFVNSMLEAGVRSMSRFAITGAEVSGSTREAQMASILEQETHGFIDMNLVDIKITPLSDFTGTPLAEPWDDVNGNGIPDPGEFSDYNCNGERDLERTDAGRASEPVLVEVTYKWMFFTPLMNVLVSSDHIDLKASTAVQTEPFTDLPALPGCPT